MLQTIHQLKLTLKKTVVHAGGWMLFILYELTLVFYISGTIPMSTFYFYLCNIALFYIHIAILINTVQQYEPAYLRAAMLIFLELLVVGIFKALGDYYTMPNSSALIQHPARITQVITMDFARSVFYIGMATLYWYRGNIARYRLRSADLAIRELQLSKDNAELESSLAHTRNAYLQQQLNPHLVFNTLNFVYSRIYKQSAEGGNAVLLLAQIMRFGLQPTDEHGMIALKDELKQIENLITINRYRYQYPLAVQLIVEGNPEHCRILPLILLTLVENMFKHGDLERNEALIRLCLPGSGSLRFTTTNTIGNVPFGKQENHTGLQNIRIRLDHAYRSNYSLTVTENGTIFKTDLIIPL